ncbi:hypothetical protein [Hydrogenophaga sp.]|uniref:hypothetical protein n=1 Tax=Hydrogenophaga sp. TaxID=1904254 RepID=UPI003F72E84F
MRSWLAIFLLVCMPLQWSWAASSAMERHHAGPAAAHHVAQAAATDSHTGLHTTDCGTCHHGCSLALLGAPLPQAVMPAAFPVALATPQPTSRPADLPERPQWRLRG